MKKIKALFASLTVTRRELLLLLSGSAILAFGLYQVHSISGVTEGGVLGLTLLGHHWLGISPSVSSLILNAACYLLGWRLLGRGFVWRSIVAGGAFSLFYAVFEQFPILFPELAEHPLIAAVAGAMFVGVGGGILRDVMAGDTPYIFVKDVYACASLAGALVCALLWRVTGHATAMIIGAMVVMVIRALSVTFHWNLPRAD